MAAALTQRDLDYLRAIYVIGGTNQPVSPTNLGKRLSISKVTAYQKMRRLECLGMGAYQRGMGLLLGDVGIARVEEIIQRHHVIELLLTKSLGISCSEACKESTRIQFNLSEDFIQLAFKKMGEPDNCECGCKITPPYSESDLTGCSWCQESFGTAGSGADGGD